MRVPSPYHLDLHGVCYVVNNEGSEGRMVVMKSFAKCTLVLLGLVLFAACGGSDNSNDINNDADYELYELELYGAEESDNDDDNDTETTSDQTLPPTTQIQTPTPQEPNDEVPFLWLVTAPHGQTMYIFGSIHVGTADLYPLSPVIMDAFRRSDYLAVEGWAPESPANPLRLLLTDDRTITDHIPEELHQRAMAVMLEHGAYTEELNNFHPLFWWQTLLFIGIELSDVSMEYGLDNFFIREALRRNMDILSIERVEDMNDMLLNLSTSLLNQLIESALDIEMAIERSYLNQKFWRQGDGYGLLYVMAGEMSALGDDEYAEFMDAMLTQRDLATADRASEFMAEGKKVFFVVGAAHLLVENNVLDLLEQKGYEVERIR